MSSAHRARIIWEGGRPGPIGALVNPQDREVETNGCFDPFDPSEIRSWSFDLGDRILHCTVDKDGCRVFIVEMKEQVALQV